MYKKTKYRFKYAFRLCKRNEQAIIDEKVASDLSSKDYNNFWKEVNKRNRSDIGIATTVNSVTGGNNIVAMWKDHFSTLLNSSVDVSDKQFVYDSITDVNSSIDMNVNISEVARSFSKIKNNKAPGHDGLTAEHFKYASGRLVLLMSLCITAMFTHCFLPDNCIKSIIVPLVKNRAGDITDKHNYRPVALNTVFSKIIEIILLNRYSEMLYSAHNQFGFKKESSTDLCLFTFKQIVQLYLEQSSCVYVCFLDISKAYDRVNHFKLFRKLIKRNLPLCIVKLLVYWYCSQTLYIRWGNYVSEGFGVSNGLRQGGVLSPQLFNVYINDLSEQLNDAGAGCNFNGVSYNNFAYADDMSLLSPSAAGLQKLLDICSEFSVQNELPYNCVKSCCLVIGKSNHVPSVKLNNVQLQFVDKIKYLGVIITSDFSDDADMRRQIGSVYCQSNTLIRKFLLCKKSVKIVLFKAFCTNFYCSQLWWHFFKGTEQKIRVAFNKGLRRLLGYDYRSSASNMFVMNGIDCYDVLMRKCATRFYDRLLRSNNFLIHNLLCSLSFYNSSFYKLFLKKCC